MKCKSLIPLLFGLSLFTFGASAQTEYYISTGANVFAPVSSDKKMYPVLGYSRKTDPEVLIGGFGAGFHVYKPIRDELFMKGALTLGRHVYWDEPVQLTDQTGNPLGAFAYSSADHTVHLLAMGAFGLGKSFRLGLGAGAHILVQSRSRLPDKNNSPFPFERASGSNGYYKPLVPVIPLEISWHSPRHIYAIRFEQAIINRYKSSLASHRKDVYGILFFEYGWRLSKKS